MTEVGTVLAILRQQSIFKPLCSPITTEVRDIENLIRRMTNTQIKFVRCFLLVPLVSSLLIYAQSNANSDAAGYAEEGKRALAQGHNEAAQAAFEKATKLQPNIAEFHAALGAICFQRHEYDEAIREIRLAQKLNRSLPKIDVLLGLSLSEVGQFREALPHLEKGFRVTTDSETRRMCGLQLLRAYSGMERYLDAVKTAIDLNQFYPNDPEVLYHTGRIYGNQAYVVMMRLHDSAPNSIWMLQAQGEANESEKNYEAALAAFQHLAVIAPQRPGVHYRMGRIHLSRVRDEGKHEDRSAAAIEFENELEVDPNNGNARYELGVIADEDGKYETARDQFQQVLLRYADFEEALVALGGCYLEMSMPSDAVPPLQRAAKLRPDDKVAWYRLSRAQHATGDDAAAAKSMATFRSIQDPNQGELQSSSAKTEITPQRLDADAETHSTTP